MHAAPRAQTETNLSRVRGEVARLSEGDVTRVALEVHMAALTRLLDDLEHRRPSPTMLVAAVRFRAQEAA